MQVIHSTLNPNSDEFQENKAAMLKQVEEFRAIEQQVIDKTETRRERFEQRGKLLPHDRVALLLDAGAPFLPLHNLAGYMMHDDKDGTEAGGATIAGIGYVAGTRVLVAASNSAIKGGTITPAGLQKTLRLQAIAKENKLPIVSLSESGGANLNYASDIFVEGARSFANQARLSAQGIPQVTVVHGNATAGGAYQPGLSDYCIMIREQSKMFLAGPPLLKAATGEVATDEELGGAEMHTGTAGTGEYLAEDDRDGIRLARELVASLGWNDLAPPLAEKAFLPPRHSEEELLGVVPNDARKPYDVREILARIADDSAFLDFKNEWDAHTVCGWIRIEGYPVGIIGNNGPITHKGAAKAAQFIQLCEQSRRPLLFLHNTTGFLVGTEQEQNGIIKHGSKMLQAVANATVPKISIVIGGSYGAGNYAMCGRGLDPQFIFAWPNSRVAVMGGQQAGMVLRIVAEQKQRSMGIEPDEKVLQFLQDSTAQKLDAQSTALYGTARLWDDGIIDPRDTRKVVAFALATCREAQQRTLHPISFGVPRL